MNTPIENFFGDIFLINLARRADRLEHAKLEFSKHGITGYELFEAYDRPVDHNGNPSGNQGCTASHRGVLELIAWRRNPKPTLVLEDDFEFRFHDTQAAFEQFVKEVPADWVMLYLGAHYAEVPPGRVSKHVVRAGRLFTTSSYGITWQQARKMAPHISGVGPIDSLYGKFNVEDPCYVLEPRLCIQYSNVSDLEGIFTRNIGPMTDPHHVAAMDAGRKTL